MDRTSFGPLKKRTEERNQRRARSREEFTLRDAVTEIKDPNDEVDQGSGGIRGFR